MQKIIRPLLSLILILTLLSGCVTSPKETTTLTENPSQIKDTNITGDNADSLTYEESVFGTDIISVEILADQEQWQTMLDNATEETYIKVDVVVNGTTFTDVGIRTKGNSSLTQVANTDSDRFSFRLKFDEYVDGQTCFGLDTFVLNNIMGDNTYMKEYISYDLMKTIGVATPLFGYSSVSVNGDVWGLYLAVEAYNDSYLERVYGDSTGELYNVKMNMEGGNFNKQGLNEDFQRPAFNQDASTDMPTPPSDQDTNSDMPAPPSDQVSTSDMPAPPSDQDTNSDMPTPPSDQVSTSEARFQPNQQNGPGGGMGAGNSGGSLAYIDDESSSYSAIFENGVGKTEESDYQKVISALKNLSTGTDLEASFDIDQILRYFAAHNFVVNLDSYSSNMAQNYYLYESDGQLTVLPWDYNLAWGGFESSNSSSVVNFPIDTPVSGVSLSDRPLLAQLFSNNDYLNSYHDYLQDIIDAYFSDGKFEAKIKAIDDLISSYVKSDPTAFCDFEAYEKAVEAFIELGNLRAKSVEGQLDGSIPSTTEAQSEDTSSLIDSTSVNLSDLGSMGGGKAGGMGGTNGLKERPNRLNNPPTNSTDSK